MIGAVAHAVREPDGDQAAAERSHIDMDALGLMLQRLRMRQHPVPAHRIGPCQLCRATDFVRHVLCARHG